jgi:hypothetical protein
VKLMWFHLMLCTDSPADFREKHSPVWVGIHFSLFDLLRQHTLSTHDHRPCFYVN